MISVRPYTEDLVAPVREFNSRLTVGDAPTDIRLPGDPTPQWLPKVEHSRLYEEYFLAVEDGAVRGGYILKHQDFSFYGDLRAVGFIRWLISEAVVNRRYACCGPMMLRAALRVQPLLCAFAAGREVALAGMLGSAGWRMATVPFYFRINNAARVFHEIRLLRKTPGRRLVTDLLASTRMGGLAVEALQFAREKRLDRGVSIVAAAGFAGWSDDLWRACRGQYGMIAVRDSLTANRLYPADNHRFHSYRVGRDGRVLGWVVVLDTQMKHNKHFGSLRVGSIVDCLALPEHACPVIQAATLVLMERGVDIVVSNQSHTAWRAALVDAGFLRGPSNYVFAASKTLSSLVEPDRRMGDTHLTRGDGDGPIHL